MVVLSTRHTLLYGDHFASYVKGNSDLGTGLTSGLILACQLMQHGASQTCLEHA